MGYLKLQSFIVNLGIILVSWILIQSIAETRSKRMFETNVAMYKPFSTPFHWFALLLNVLLCMDVLAQPSNCSELIKLDKDEGQQFIAGTTAEGYYIASENERSHAVELRYYTHADFQLKKTVRIDLPEGNKDQRFKQLLYLTDGFIVFTGGYSKESEQYQIMATVLDAEGQKVYPPSLVHYTMDQTSAKQLKFMAIISPDATKILLLFDSKVERKKDAPLSLKVYDRDLELLWEKELELPYQTDILEVHNYAIDDNADVFLMSGRNPEKDQTGPRTIQIGKHAVFYYSHANNKLKEYSVGLRDKQVVSAIFEVHTSGDLMIAGYYSNDAEFAAAGTFLFTIAAGGGAVKAASLMPFSKDFLLKFMREKQLEQRPTLTDYYLDHLLFTKDGQILLVGEQYYVTEAISADPMTGNQQREYRYHFDNIIATLLNPEGRQQWSAKISKAQYVLTNPTYCSYALFQKGEGWEFYFNDALENESKLSSLTDGEATAWGGGSRSQVTCVALDTSGLAQRHRFCSNEEDGLLLEPTLNRSAQESQMILRRAKGRQVRYCRK
jgi:hypothetical protein